jgi:hypothetical protein
MQIETRFFRGDFIGSEEHFAAGNAYFETRGFKQMRGAETGTFGNASLNAWCARRVDTARARSRWALEGSQRNRFDLMFAKFMTGSLHLNLGEPARAEALATEAFAYAQEHGFPELALWSLMLLGGARAELGSAEGVALLRQAVARAKASGNF